VTVEMAQQTGAAAGTGRCCPPSHAM
jgi:hypothetical protein